MTDAELSVLEAVTEYAADRAAERDERPGCVKDAREVIAEEERIRYLMDTPSCYGAGCPTCK